MKPVNMGLVGLNFGYQIACKILENPEIRPFIELVAFCDRDRDKAVMLAERHGIKKVCSSLEEMLTDPLIEAVGLFTGPVGRAKLIDKILDAGKDVLTTKPFESSADEAERILKKAERLGRVVQMNSPAPRMTEDLQQIARWREEYKLGRPIAYHAATWCSYREEPDGRWYDDPRLCPVAPIFRLGIYLMNDVSHFFSGVKDVHVFQSRIFTKRPTADNAQLSVLYNDGSIGNLFASFCVDNTQPYLYAMQLHFERGTVYRNCGADAVYGKIALELAAKDENSMPVRQSRSFHFSSEEYQYENFCKAVNGIPLENPVPIETVVSAVRILEMMSKYSAID